MTDLVAHHPVRFAPDRLREALEADAEFTLTTRYLTARVQVRIGDQVMNLRFIDGEVASLSDVDTGFTSYDILVAADETTWAEMLRETPRPFFQDLWSAKFYHGVRLEGDLDLLSAYYPGLSRMCSVMRSLHGAESAR